MDPTPDVPKKSASPGGAALAAFVAVIVLGVGAYFAFRFISKHRGSPSSSQSSSGPPIGKWEAVQGVIWGTRLLDQPLDASSSVACRDGCKQKGAVGANWSGEKCGCVMSHDPRNVALQACWTQAGDATAYLPTSYKPATQDLCKPDLTSCPGRVPLDDPSILGSPSTAKDWWSCLDSCMTGGTQALGALITDTNTCRCVLPGWNSGTAVGGSCLLPDTDDTSLLLIPPDDCAKPICAPKNAGWCTPFFTTGENCDGKVDTNNCAEGASPVILMRDSPFLKAAPCCGCRCQFPFLTTSPGSTTMVNPNSERNDCPA